MRSLFDSHMLTLALIVTVPLLSACQTSKKVDNTTTGTSCASENGGCLRQNLAEVQEMISDPENTWVENPAPNVGPSGNRLIAYISTAPRLSCSHLQVGQAETDQALILLEPKNGEDIKEERRNLLNVANQASGTIATELQQRCGNATTRV